MNGRLLEIRESATNFRFLPTFARQALDRLIPTRWKQSAIRSGGSRHSQM